MEIQLPIMVSQELLVKQWRNVQVLNCWINTSIQITKCRLDL